MRSIRFRLVLAHTALFALAIVLLGAAANRLMRAYRYTDLDNQLEDREAALRGYLTFREGKPTWTFDPQDQEQVSFLLRAARFYQIFNSHGEVVDTSRDAELLGIPFTSVTQEAFDTQEPQWETLLAAGNYSLRVLNTPLRGPRGVLYVFRLAASLEPIERAQRQFLRLLLLVVPLVVLAGGITGWWMSGQMFHRVTHIASAAERITASDLSRRLPLAGRHDEIDQLSATLNRMIARLEDSFEQMRQFLVNISHELRTPLAALRGECEIALRTARAENDYREALQSNLEELDRLARTVSNLLTLAQAEAGETQITVQNEDLSKLVHDAADGMLPLATERGIEISVHADEGVIAPVDAEQVLRLVWNLLDNAIKFNQPGGRVEMTLSQQDGGAVLSIADNGCGIASEDLPHIFERFYRAKDARARATEGSGIGLSLARWIAEVHGGRIEAVSRPGEGSTFRVWLPLTQSTTKPDSTLRGEAERGTHLPGVSAADEARPPENSPILPSKS